MADRYYVVTFDLEDSQGREAEYELVRRDLKLMVGPMNYHRPLKRCCIIRTNKDAQTIRNTMTQKLGDKCNILIARLRHGFAFRIRDPELRVRTSILMRSIRE